MDKDSVNSKAPSESQHVTEKFIDFQRTPSNSTLGQVLNELSLKSIIQILIDDWTVGWTNFYQPKSKSKK